MATISTDTFLDGGTARTAGETWTINGCKLTIRTDTRWHANAPASMTGSLGTLTVSSAIGGSIVVDSRNVRWMVYDTGSGNVPAIGTSITQGGVSGYLLGVWADYQSAPTAPGAAMPASGYLKFREVTGGAFSAGALTGIGANATSADVVGWIEVCTDASANFAGQELGDGVQFKGDWFYLGETNGSRGQTISTPINGGGANSFVFGVQIETAAGSGVYEWYPTAHASLNGAIWATANFTTDARSKVVEALASGQIRIGSNGSVDIGYLPPTGCKIRMPNIIGRTVSAAARATNQTPGAVTRSRLDNGNIDIDGLHCDWILNASSPAVKTTIKRYCQETTMTLIDNASTIVMDDCCIGGFTHASGTILGFTRVYSGTFSKVKVIGSATITGTVRSIAPCGNLTFNDCEVINAKARTGTVTTLSLTDVSNTTFTNFKTKGGRMSFATCLNVTFNNTDYIDRTEGATTSANAHSVFSLTAVNGFTINGLTFGEGGTIVNTQCYSAVVNGSTNSNTNVKVRNFGTRTTPLDCGSNASFYPAQLCTFQGNDNTVKIQRCFLSGTRNGLFNAATNNQVGIYIEDIYGPSGASIPVPNGRNAVYRKFNGNLTSSNITANLGSHWIDTFNSDTTGEIRFFGAAPSTESLTFNTINVTPSQGTGYVSSIGAISLDTQNDYVIAESPWMFLGHTGFRNVAPAYSGTTTGMTFGYDLDTGSGYTGTWKTLNTTNLTAETVSASGFKIKLKITQTSTSSFGTSFQYVSIYTTTTVAAQADNQYPLDTVTLSFEGLKPGSEVRAYVGTDPATAVEIGGTESTAGSTFSFSHSSSGQDGYIAIFALGFNPLFIPRTYAYQDSTLLISQVVDRNYNNPA